MAPGHHIQLVVAGLVGVRGRKRRIEERRKQYGSRREERRQQNRREERRQQNRREERRQQNRREPVGSRIIGGRKSKKEK